jgi:hypothetical protein
MQTELLSAGVLTIDEVREMRGLSPLQASSQGTPNLGPLPALPGMVVTS